MRVFTVHYSFVSHIIPLIHQITYGRHKESAQNSPVSKREGLSALNLTRKTRYQLLFGLWLFVLPYPTLSA